MRWGTSDEYKLRDSEAVEKVRETVSIVMIIGEILCLLAYIACPLLLLPLELWIQPQIKYTFTNVGMALHRIITDLDSRYCKVKFSDASWNKLTFVG